MDHPLQHLLSPLEHQQGHGAQRHPVCQEVHHLLLHPLAHLYQEGLPVQQAQDCPAKG